MSSSHIEVHKPPLRAALPGTLIHRLRRHYIKPGQQLAGGINQEALVRIQAKARDLLKTLDEVKPT